MARLSVNIGNLQLKNPVMTASGTFGYGLEFTDFVDLSQIGGIFVKGTTAEHREGNPYPRMADCPYRELSPPDPLTPGRRGADRCTSRTQHHGHRFHGHLHKPR